MNGLFGSPVLEVAIGLAFVYLLLSLMCTALNEWLLSYFLKLRSKLLRQTLDALLGNQRLGDADFRTQFDSHPVISKGQASASRGAPSYLSAKAFATAVLDLVASKAKGSIQVKNVEAGLEAMPEGDLKRTLNALTIGTKGDPVQLRRDLEDWFNDSMDRTSGVFKRHAQAWAMVVAALLTLLTNADTLAITRKLWQNGALRAEVVKLAEQRAEMPRPTVVVEYRDPDDPLNPTVVNESQNSLTAGEEAILGQLVGWEKPVTDYRFGDLVSHIPGWILTTIAVSLGAPFWFDVLNRFMKLRNAGNVPARRTDEEAAAK